MLGYTVRSYLSKEGRREGGIKGCTNSFVIEYITCVLLLEKESLESEVYRDNGDVILRVII